MAVDAKWLAGLEERYPALFDLHGDGWNPAGEPYRAAAAALPAGPEREAMVELAGIMARCGVALTRGKGGVLLIKAWDEAKASQEELDRMEALWRAHMEAVAEVFGPLVPGGAGPSRAIPNAGTATPEG